jgi:hypothetical protein
MSLRIMKLESLTVRVWLSIQILLFTISIPQVFRLKFQPLVKHPSGYDIRIIAFNSGGIFSQLEVGILI